VSNKFHPFFNNSAVFGVRKVQNFGTGIGFSSSNMIDNSNEIIKSTIEKEIKKTFAPEFINRIGEIVMFNNLSKDNIRQIIELGTERLRSKITNMGYNITILDSAYDFLCEKGYDSIYVISKWAQVASACSRKSFNFTIGCMRRFA
jgi:ATP-dependent Clp protease ATP-binding subunit ClpC